MYTQVAQKQNASATIVKVADAQK